MNRFFPAGYIVAFFISMVLTSCNEEEPQHIVVDSHFPAAQYEMPEDGETVAGTIILSATAAPKFSSGGLVFSIQIDGQWMEIGRDSAFTKDGIYATLWNTRELKDDEYTLGLFAGDKTKNEPLHQIKVETGNRLGIDSGTFVDSRDSNTYKWVKIGKQVWMAENLKYLPTVNSEFAWWLPEEEPAYIVSNYKGTNVAEAKSTNNYKTYGVLYNRTAALNACPNGWHLPTNEEWLELINYNLQLGPFEYNFEEGNYHEWFEIGRFLKARGTKKAGDGLWKTEMQSNAGADLYGFSALPGGWFMTGEPYSSPGYFGSWWSSTKNQEVWQIVMHASHTKLSMQSTLPWIALSIRCVKDEEPFEYQTSKK